MGTEGQEKRSPDIRPSILRRMPSGSSEAVQGADTTSRPSSTPSEPPVKGSNVHWRLPKSVADLASQANVVSTLLLNGSINLETARTYSALLRGVAQLVSVEVATARLTHRRPSLDLTEVRE